MVTWTKAFMSALKIIAYSIGFWIIGAVLIGARRPVPKMVLNGLNSSHRI